DQRLVANIAVFLNDYEDLQREVVLPSDAGFATVVRNAATAEIKGLELEMIAIPTANFTARLSYGYIDSEYKSFPADLAGTGIIVDNSDLRLPFTPKHSLSVGADYRLPLTSGDEITFAVSATKKSRYTVQPLDLQVGADDGYTTTDVSIRYDLANQRLGFEVYALNIADQHYITAAENLGGSANYKLDGPRHTYGARIFFTY
ncbi:MAG: TonB-dependent receptor, partial [Porticoccaceae bacterium]|nr:TonB-dependent receptor [Porticoccaceae bacterium]